MILRIVSLSAFQRKAWSKKALNVANVKKKWNIENRNHHILEAYGPGSVFLSVFMLTV